MKWPLKVWVFCKIKDDFSKQGHDYFVERDYVECNLNCVS